MKDSGLPWLGEVPEHWKKRKLRSLLVPVEERGRADLPMLSVVREKGIILRDRESKDENRNFIPDDLSNYRVVRKGQFAINKMKSWQGSYGVSAYDGIVSPAYYVYALGGVGGPFFHRAIRSRAYSAFFAQASDGVRISQWDLSRARMKEIPFFLPTLNEQAAIVRLLDYADRRIRRYIRAKQRLIKLLEEQKQAIIHQAVTGQIDVRTGKPYPAYKPSGVEWVGYVPGHWTVLPAVAALREKKIRNVGMIEGRVLSLSYGRIVVKPPEKLHGLVPKSFETYQIVDPGDIIVRPTDLQNDQKSLRVGIVEERGIITSAYLCLEVEPTLVAGFAHLLLHAYDLVKVFYVLGSGTRQNLRFSDLKRIPMLCPPEDEQEHIVEGVRRLASEADEALEKAGAEISLLREYRTRLIADVVTGKLDVREAASRLPDEAEEPELVEDVEKLAGEGDEDAEAELEIPEEESEE